MLTPVDQTISLADREEKTIAYWQKNKIFEKSLKKNPADKQWHFLDGPPFVTGMPHYGSLLSSLPKDVFPRFWTMKGYTVRRVWGWDGHGLPIENKVEVELGIARKKDIETKIGVEHFVERCLHYLNQVSSEWKWYVDHVGRWVDFDNAYKTWDIAYMESVMWVFKQMYDKGHIYKGLRVSLYCPHCATPISNFEVAMDADNHKEMADPAAVYKYKLEDEEKTFLLAWSTTPWNKIVTPALAVNPHLAYVKVKQGYENYILAKSTMHMLKKEPTYQILEEFKGKKLIGKKFAPHYDYYPLEEGEKAFEVIPGDFVTAVEGTGIVTIAAYGEEDLVAMQAHHIHIETHLDEDGNIKPDVPLFGGLYYLKANKFVNEDLEKRGLVYHAADYSHTVPLCWRCHTRLYYAPQNAWYVDVQTLKPLLKETNKDVQWFPAHFKFGRFLKSLEHAPDWNISRNRYWGSPVPVWECVCGERFVPGSIEELERRSHQKITTLHKPQIDSVSVTCEKCGGNMVRTPEVLDSWIEAGSASFAERHFPFDKTQKLENFFPPDFIVEYTGQIRAWFYVLHVIAGALYGSKAFKNVAVTGVILGTDGRKMSKNFKNYPDPKEMLKKYGADALRLYLLGSPVMHGEDILISEEFYRNQVRGTLLILWNIYNFFVSYAIVDNWKNENKKTKQTILDEWLISLFHQLEENVTNSLEKYDTVDAIAKIQQFITEFSTWYIRRSRERVGPAAENHEDKQAFYATTFYVLTTLCKIAAPIVPFITEDIYRNLTGEASVHLTNWPKIERNVNEKLLQDMQDVRTIIQAVLAVRKEKGIKVRQPLGTLYVVSTGDASWLEKYATLLKEELNIKKLDYMKTDSFADKNVAHVMLHLESKKLDVYLDTTLTIELKAEGEAREIIRQVQEERKKLGTTLDEKVSVVLPHWPKNLENFIKQHALIDRLERGETLQVSKLS